MCNLLKCDIFIWNVISKTIIIKGWFCSRMVVERSLWASRQYVAAVCWLPWEPHKTRVTATLRPPSPWRAVKMVRIILCSIKWLVLKSNFSCHNIDGLMQRRGNFSALAMKYALFALSHRYAYLNHDMAIIFLNMWFSSTLWQLIFAAFLVRFTIAECCMTSLKISPGHGLMLSGNIPLPEPMLAKMHEAISIAQGVLHQAIDMTSPGDKEFNTPDLSIVCLDPQMRQKRRQMSSQQKRNHRCYWSERWQWILRCWRHGQTRCWSTGCLIWRGYRGCCCWHRIHALLKGPTRWVLQRKWKWYNLGVMYVNWAACWLVHKRRCKSRV